MLTRKAIILEIQRSDPRRGLFPARRKTRNRAEALNTLSLEKNLTPELLGVFVKPVPELAFSPVDIARLQLHCDCLIRLSRKNYVLVVWVRLFYPLLICTHDADLGGDAWSEVWKLELKQQPVLARVRVAYFCDAISRPS